MMDERRLRELLGGFGEVSLAVVGDFFLDKYLVLDPSLTEISLETGLEAYQVVERRCSPGAAGTVTSNLRALEVGPIFAVGVIGDDGEGYELRQGLKARRVDTDHLLMTPDRFTPTYTKPMVRKPDGTEVESNRQDIKNRRPLDAETERRVIERLRRVVPEVWGVIIADQVQERNCGVITDAVREELDRLAAEYPDTIFLADSRVRIGEFRGVCIKPNRHEAALALGRDPGDATSLERVREMGQALLQRAGKPVYLTLSEEGILLFSDQGITHVPAVPVTGPIDIVGAGDSCTAGIVSALCAGATHEEAAEVGNLVASVTVRKIGTTGTASPEEVLSAWREVSG